MSIPDFDYELEKLLGQHEYPVSLAEASTPEEMGFVAKAFKAGQEKEQDRIYKELLANSNGYDHIHIAIFKLRKIIYND